MRTTFRRLLGAGALAAAGYALWRAYQSRRVDTGLTWEAGPFPYPPEPHATAPAAAADDARAWVEPDPEGACPSTHPVKAKLASGIFHVPGGASYGRTKADRCYASAEDAVADGLRAARA